MRVQLATGDRGGCFYYRMNLPYQVLKHEMDVFINDEVQSIRDAKTKEVTDGLPADEGVDVLVVQRPTYQGIVETLPAVQARGVAVVVEIDDDLTRVHPGNAAYRALTPKTSPHENYQHLQKACQFADWVVVSTPRLAEVFAPHGRVSVVRNYVEDAWLDISRPPSDGRVLGWTGTLATHPTDLAECGSAFADAIEATGARPYVVGDGDALAHFGITEPRGAYAEWVELDQYPHELAKFSVGVVPLEDSKFNEAKSWLKGLEYAAMGVPFVASPVREYREFVEGLPGCSTAKRYRHWLRDLTALLERDDLDEVSEALRTVVRERFTISKHAHEYAEAWERALNHRRKQVPTKSMWPFTLPPLRPADPSLLSQGPR